MSIQETLIDGFDFMGYPFNYVSFSVHQQEVVFIFLFFCMDK